MKLSEIRQGAFEDVSHQYDVVISSSGYESRARHVASQLEDRHVAVQHKYAFAFKEHTQECARPENDKFFAAHDYKAIDCSGHSASEARSCTLVALDAVRGMEKARILVDISCMTRAWYGEIVRVLLMQTDFQELRVDFAYVFAEFAPPSGQYPPNRVAGPVPGFVGMTMPDKPTVLGIGLGYHRDRAIGLQDYLDPRLTVLFYSNPALDPRYVDAVRSTNEQILDEVSGNNVIPYSACDCVMTFTKLNSFCEGMMRNSRVVLCSLGPKIFGLCCFLVAAVHRDISVWRVSAGDFEEPFDHKPDGKPLLLETVWQRT